MEGRKRYGPEDDNVSVCAAMFNAWIFEDLRWKTLLASLLKTVAKNFGQIRKKIVSWLVNFISR